MLHRLDKLVGFDVFAEDEKLGEIHDIYFEDSGWKAKYAIVQSGERLLGERFIIAMEVLGETYWESGRVDADISKEEIENRPKVSFAEPVSREELSKIHQHYQWTPIRPTGGATQSPVFGPYPILPPTADIAERKKLQEEGEANLRSVEEVEGYEIECEDDCIGSVQGFFANEDWTIRYLLVDIGRWISKKKVLVAPDWVSQIDWFEGEITIDLTKDQIRNSPQYDSSEPPSREYEIALYDFYHQPGYWL